ncbi:hypothetical protein RE6C_03647 [Rhodopirellula europaea 6C]|uniref:Uncharacterized protein n=1 Tax=Rhodopirellula europaea 6C TaxID=1263867 RepID=M2B1B3_9BACT|nr:hypothetical protein RE6C_03647 [Rhodopirellula europaea 6C]
MDSHAESGRCQISEWHSEGFAENQDCDTFYQLDEDEGNRLLRPIGIERCRDEADAGKLGMTIASRCLSGDSVFGSNSLSGVMRCVVG